MTGLLASVATLDEMDLARDGGAGIVDLKNPDDGALGAWERSALIEAVVRWRGWAEPRPMLSATIGDQPMTPGIVRAAAEAVAATGVPMVKLGLFAGGDPKGCIEALAPLALRAQLIAVFFGDLDPDVSLLKTVADAGFRGAMIDTADKTGGGLRGHMDPASIAGFVAQARRLGLMTGLAGSLTLDDIGPLATLRPDYFGFRGALCEGGRRGRIDADAVRRVAGALRSVRQAA